MQQKEKKPKKKSPKKKVTKQSSQKDTAVITTTKKPTISFLALTEKKKLVQNTSPFHKEKVTEISPERKGNQSKLTKLKASLAIKQETVEKELDSILGDSPSPSKQVERIDWTVVSPIKFALKLDRVDTVQEELQPVEASSDEKMSSHDLSAEEEESDHLHQLKRFRETDE